MDDPTPYSAMEGRVRSELLLGLAAMGYTHMTPVQQQVLQLPDFSRDCLVQAKTGTGKTTAFLLPTLHTLLKSPAKLPAGQVGLLVMAPTRELASQIADECHRLTQFCKSPLECHLAHGGSNKQAFLNRFLEGNPAVLVATPGRLLDYLSESHVQAKFTSLRALVLDEADTMLDRGFRDDIVKILGMLPPKAPDGWQGMCFSATMPARINEVIHHVLAPNYARISTIKKEDAPTVDAIPQTLIAVPGIEAVLPTLHALLALEAASSASPLKAVVFIHTARNADLLYHIFSSPGVVPENLPVHQVHSRMSQPARNKTVEAFKKPGGGLLFASDVVGRGMDFPDVALVVQIGLPMNSEQYVHRVGRTGRAGKVGKAVLVLAPEEIVFLKKNKKFPIQEVAFSQRSTESSLEVLSDVLVNLPDRVQEQAYGAFLGYLKTHGRLLRLNGPEMVAIANRFSESIGCEEPPALPANVIGKMGFKGVRGLRTKKADSGGNGGSGDGGGGGGSHGPRGGAAGGRSRQQGRSSGNGIRGGVSR